MSTIPGRFFDDGELVESEEFFDWCQEQSVTRLGAVRAVDHFTLSTAGRWNRAWPTYKQRPGESLMEWSERLDVYENGPEKPAKEGWT